MKAPRNKNEYYRTVYRQVIDRYKEAKSVNGTSGAFNYLSLGNPGGGSFNPRVVRASLSDFIADVEIAARKSLNPKEHQSFQKDVSEDLGALQGERANNELIQRKLGQSFLDRKIYPTELYFRSVDTR